ncbi:MAG: PQQ-binding-like beta-propeller repeat protein [Acidobacteria bacterium]|nr:PQQ-binding-like beta-propeller repeat protein [Acidobacteriota bacterium]
MRFRFLQLISAFLLIFAGTLLAEDWARFRGPNGSGVSDATGLPTTFGPDENVIWKTELPNGNSSPVFGKTAIFVTGSEGESLFTMALDRTSGRALWRREIARERQGQLREPNRPAAPSAVTDGENAFVFFQDLGLVSYGPDGNERWRVPLGPFNNPFGLGASPILAEGKVIMVCDSETESFVIAVDQKTGKLAWRQDRPMAKRGYSTPVLWDPPDGSGLQFLIPTSFELQARSVETGEKIWWVRSLTWQLKPTPVIEDDTIYVLGWAGQADLGNQEDLPPFDEIVSQHDNDGDGRISSQEAEAVLGKAALTNWYAYDLDRTDYVENGDWEVWRAKRKSVNSMQAIKLGGRGDMTKSAIKWQYYKALPNVPSPLLYGDVIYMVKDGGIVTSLDKRTGEVLKQGRLPEALDRYFASPVAADGKVFLASEPGVVSVLRHGKEWEVLAANKMDGECYATPVIMDGKIYVRTSKALYCFGNR